MGCVSCRLTGSSKPDRRSAGGTDFATYRLRLDRDVKGVFVMVLHGLLARAAPTVATGVVGVAAYSALAKAPWRQATVIATAWGLRVAREAERQTKQRAERARLAVADVLAEAVERIGEDSPPAAVADLAPTATS